MATNYIQPGRILDLTAPAGGFTSGTPALVDGMCVIPQADGDSGDTVACAVEGVYQVTKATGTAWSEGQRIYFDSENDAFTSLRKGRAVGTAAEAAASGDTTGNLRLQQVAGLEDDSLGLTDSDDAASDGVQLYLVQLDPAGPYLTAVNAGNADSHVELANGDYIPVIDDDAAATAGVAVYFDEDAAEDARLMFVSPINKPAFLKTAYGRTIIVSDNDDAATDGVSVYFDDDAAEATAKFLFVSPTNTDGEAFARGAL